jgi:FtsP/CotA-like multicopper oxidase with cupredoxin domain
MRWIVVHRDHVYRVGAEPEFAARRGVARELPRVLELGLGRSYVLELVNRTAWWHPIHLHGHNFRVLTRDGAPIRFWEWRDTVLLAPRERVEIGFVADNAGAWMVATSWTTRTAA